MYFTVFLNEDDDGDVSLAYVSALTKQQIYEVDLLASKATTAA